MLQQPVLQQPDRGTADHILAVYAMLLDMYFSMGLQEVVHLGVADHLRDGPKSADVLAKQVGVQEDMLTLLMRTMCSKDVFVEIEEGIFAHTEKSRYLQTDIPCSLVSVSELIRSDSQRKLWTPEALTYTLQTGKSAFEHVFGESFWEYLMKHPAELALADSATTSLLDSINETIAEACDLTGLHSLVDVGGGDGSFLATLLLQHPEMTGTLLDLPPVIEAKAQKMGTELAGRWMCQAGDFFQSVPEGGDAYILKQILTHWNDEDCLKILGNCRRAIAPSGKLFIIEYILPTPPNKPTPYLVTGLIHRQWFDEDHQRTEQQLRHLLDQTGFEFVSLTPTNADDGSILQARARE
jgi:2-polyprenyl-3-methyl-5-hydroxy-6-metoxy-1,4-benzoquinol methylase